MAKADKRARKRANQQQAAAARAAAQKRAARTRQIRFGVIAAVLIVGVVAVVALTGNDHKTALLKPGCVATTPKKSGNGKQYKTPPKMTIDPNKTYTATFDTTCGKFTATLDAKDSPKGVNNFVFLARAGFYNGLKWHRVVQDFVIQGGDPTGTGNGGPGYSVVTEWPKNGFKTGDLAWAKTGAEPAGTAGSQFFVTTGDPAPLNGTKKTTGGKTTYDYGYFGHVTSGLANAKKLESFAVPSDQTGAPSHALYIFSITISEK